MLSNQNKDRISQQAVTNFDISLPVFLNIALGFDLILGATVTESALAW